MKVLDIYSKRRKALAGAQDDVFVYDAIPAKLRTQIIHIMNDSFGDEQQYADHIGQVRGAYGFVLEALCREYGVFELVPAVRHNGRHDAIYQVQTFVLKAADADQVLDTVELAFDLLDRLGRTNNYIYRSNPSQVVDDAIGELNVRFRENAVGYQFEGGQIVRIDSDLLHAEVVKPALALLRDPTFAGAQAEFLKAHEHYRHGNAKEALVECLKTIESTMKIIADKRSWVHSPTATARDLIELMYTNQLIPDFWRTHFGGLRSMLESGVPTIRNREAGHGQGVVEVAVPLHLVAYAVHQTAAAVVFLAEAEKALP